MLLITQGRTFCNAYHKSDKLNISSEHSQFIKLEVFFFCAEDTGYMARTTIRTAFNSLFHTLKGKENFKKHNHSTNQNNFIGKIKK
jgi:hypothetical protein